MRYLVEIRCNERIKSNTTDQWLEINPSAESRKCGMCNSCLALTCIELDTDAQYTQQDKTIDGKIIIYECGLSGRKKETRPITKVIITP